MTEQKNLEKKILVLPTESLSLKEGFAYANKEEILNLAEECGLYKPRHKMEEDENFQQLIPYIAVKKDDKILIYQRSKKGAENRLHNMYSLGVGGHIDYPDTLVEAALRELEEEIHIKANEEDLKFAGFINTSENSVDRVHLGVAIVLELTENLDFLKGEVDKIVNRAFKDKSGLDKIIDDGSFETWSRVFYESYLRDIL